MTAKLKELETLKHIFWYLTLALFAMIILYAYLVNKTVHNVAERERIETEKSQLNSKLSELEFAYISKRNDISPEFAYALGFQDVKKQEFISLKKSSNELSLKN